MMFRKYRLRPVVRVIVRSLVASFFVVAFSLALQWLVYGKWLHRDDPFRITGTFLASILAFLLLWSWQEVALERQRELQYRLEVVRQMNDRIRNALQVIEVTSYLSQPRATAPIREAVETIDNALREGSAEVISLPNDKPEEVSLAGGWAREHRLTPEWGVPPRQVEKASESVSE